jgi:hypothetical protein
MESDLAVNIIAERSTGLKLCIITEISEITKIYNLNPVTLGVSLGALDILISNLVTCQIFPQSGIGCSFVILPCQSPSQTHARCLKLTLVD